MKLLTIKTFTNSVDAHILKTILETEGIESFVFDENMSSMYPMTMNNMFGGVKLQIAETDLDLALEIIKDYDAAKLTDSNGDEIMCRRCGSTDIIYDYRSYKGFFAKLRVLVSLALFIPASSSKTVGKCKKCGAEFSCEE
jgi:ribosomal protein L37E